MVIVVVSDTEVIVDVAAGGAGVIALVIFGQMLLISSEPSLQSL